MNHSQPISQISVGSEATHTPGDNSSKIQSHCQEPYYQAVPAGESPLAGEPASICLPPSKGPVAPTFLAPPPSSEPHLISLLRDTHLQSPEPWETDAGEGGDSSLCAWWVVTCQHCDYATFQTGTCGPGYRELEESLQIERGNKGRRGGRRGEPRRSRKEAARSLSHIL